MGGGIEWSRRQVQRTIFRECSRRHTDKVERWTGNIEKHSTRPQHEACYRPCGVFSPAFAQLAASHASVNSGCFPPHRLQIHRIERGFSSLSACLSVCWGGGGGYLKLFSERIPSSFNVVCKFNQKPSGKNGDRIWQFVLPPWSSIREGEEGERERETSV